MIVFISTVLILAAAESVCKLALLPRRFEFLTALVLAPLPLFLERRIAGLSLRALNAELTAASTLENWCAVVVIQELFALTAGFSLISDFSGGGTSGGPRPRRTWWKMSALFPSLLLPAGIFYLQIRLFNAFPEADFRTLSGGLAAAVPAAVILAAEAIRFFRRDTESRIGVALNLEYLLLAPAIFLPVAARARLMPEAAATGEEHTGIVLGALAAFVASSALGFRIYDIVHQYNLRKKTP